MSDNQEEKFIDSLQALAKSRGKTVGELTIGSESEFKFIGVDAMNEGKVYIAPSKCNCKGLSHEAQCPIGQEKELEFKGVDKSLGKYTNFNDLAHKVSPERRKELKQQALDEEKGITLTQLVDSVLAAKNHEDNDHLALSDVLLKQKPHEVTHRDGSKSLVGIGSFTGINVRDLAGNVVTGQTQSSKIALTEAAPEYKSLPFIRYHRLNSGKDIEITYNTISFEQGEVYQACIIGSGKRVYLEIIGYGDTPGKAARALEQLIANTTYIHFPDDIQQTKIG